MNADPQPCLKGGQALLGSRLLVPQMEVAEQLPAVGVDGVGLQHQPLLPAGQLGNQNLRDKTVIVQRQCFGSGSELLIRIRDKFFQVPDIGSRIKPLL
jgi:hypothetical protein